MTEDIKDPDDWTQAAEFTLGLLPEGEAKAFVTAMVTDPAKRAAYAHWAENFATLTDPIGSVHPPAEVKTKIMAQIFEDKPLEKEVMEKRFGLLPAMASGLIGAFAVLWLLDFSGAMRWLDGPEFAARIAAKDESLIVQASYDADTGIMTLGRTAGAAREGRVQELWLVVDTRSPVSLGLLSDAETFEIMIPANIAAGLTGAVLAISDEPPGGSPTGAPTGDILAAGPVISL